MQLSYQERAQLQHCSWWQPQPKSTFLIRVCTVQNYLLIFVTDLRDVFIGRRTLKELLLDKQKFNKTLQVKEQELLELLRSKLAVFDSKARYGFAVKNAGRSLLWDIKLPLAIYNFTWEFMLEQQPQFELRRYILNEMLLPLVGALGAQEDRCAILQAKMPVSDRLAKPGDWDQLMRNNRGRTVNTLGASSKYLLEHYSDKPKEQPSVSFSPSVKVQLARHEKQPEITTIDQSIRNEELLVTQLEQKKEKDKAKKKKIDFL